MILPMPESPFPVGYFQVLIVSVREYLIFSVRIQTVETKMVQVGKVNRVTVSPVEQCAKPWEFRYTVPQSEILISSSVYESMSNPCYFNIQQGIQGESTEFRNMNIAHLLRTCCLPAVYDATCWSDVRAALRALATPSGTVLILLVMWETKGFFE